MGDNCIDLLSGAKNTLKSQKIQFENKKFVQTLCGPFQKFEATITSHDIGNGDNGNVFKLLKTFICIYFLISAHMYACLFPNLFPKQLQLSLN